MADNLVMMRGRGRDSGDEVLLDLDGQVFVVDTKGGYWVRFSVRRAPLPRSAAWAEVLVNTARSGRQPADWI